MGNLFNFNKNVTAIIKPKLKMLGFKSKGNNSYREANGFTEEIRLSGSQWNGGQFEEQEFFVEVAIKRLGFYHDAKIPNNPLINKPDRFDDYYNLELYDNNSDKRNKAFSEEETEIICGHYRKLWWRYKNEDELKEVLNAALNIIVDYGLKYISEIEDLGISGIESHSYNPYKSPTYKQFDKTYKKNFSWGCGLGFK